MLSTRHGSNCIYTHGVVVSWIKPRSVWHWQRVNFSRNWCSIISLTYSCYLLNKTKLFIINRIYPGWRVFKLDLDFAHHNFESTVLQTKNRWVAIRLWLPKYINIFFFGKIFRFIKLHFNLNDLKNASCVLVWEFTNSLMHRIDLGVLNPWSGASFRLYVWALLVMHSVRERIA